MARNVYTVKQVNAYIKNMFTQDFMLNRIYVKGEVSNCKYHTSGHIYFSLKDESGTIACVMFAGQRGGLSFHMREGQQIIVLGSVNVYERTGAYQLYANEIRLDGEGALYEKYQMLKQELEEMGMFAPEYKQEIPAYAKRIGVVTAPTGAAVRDIMNISARRNPYVQLILYPAQVQGEGAKESIVRGIRMLEAYGVDVMIVGRGGGSIEDLWAFNDESLARTISQSRIPVISAVGHETDFTICDFAADLRAPTPSAAAELAVPDMREYQAYFLQVCRKLKQAVSSRISAEKARVDWSVNRPAMRSPLHFIEQKRILLDTVSNRLNQGFLLRVSKAENRLSVISGKLDALSPFRVLGRGYSLVLKQGSLIKTVNDLKKDDGITVKLSDGEAKCQVIGVLPESKEEIL